jgi:pimeloyl-ACP methyl ester carboxylesterase
MRLKAGELSFNVLETGSGEPTLLFLHYWGGSARTWNAVTAQLSTNFRCIAYDQRGWGQSDAPEQGYSIRDLALDAAHIVEALRLHRYVLVGHSMGGKVAQFLASQRPPGLVGLVLVAPATPTPQNLPEPAKQAQLHAYDDRENALKAMAFLTAFPPRATRCASKSYLTTSPVHLKRGSRGRHRQPCAARRDFHTSHNGGGSCLSAGERLGKSNATASLVASGLFL